MSSPNPVPPAKNGGSAQPFVFSAPGSEASREPGNGWHTAPPPSAADLQSERQAFERGLAEGEARARASAEKSFETVRSQVTEALRHFAGERAGYFQRVETEIVQLALSIARKILHREAQLDPLLLTGIVRVALETLNQETRVRLRVHPQDVSFWRDYLAHAPDLTPVPELAGEAALEPGSCLLETELGSTLISLDSQLKEIEQGFLDLLEHRPQVRE